MADKERIIIKGPAGDEIEIIKDDFADSHYAEQDYEIVGPAPENVPDVAPGEGEPNDE